MTEKWPQQTTGHKHPLEVEIERLRAFIGRAIERQRKNYQFDIPVARDVLDGKDMPPPPTSPGRPRSMTDIIFEIERLRAALDGLKIHELHNHNCTAVIGGPWTTLMALYDILEPSVERTSLENTK